MYLLYCLRAVECLFAGAGRHCVALSIAKTSVRPLSLRTSSLSQPCGTTSLPFSLSLSHDKNRPQDHKVIPNVAGCTTGSLCPRCPYIRDEVLSLYKAEFLYTGTHLNCGGLEVLCPTALCAPKHDT